MSAQHPHLKPLSERALAYLREAAYAAPPLTTADADRLWPLFPAPPAAQPPAQQSSDQSAAA